MTQTNGSEIIPYKISIPIKTDIRGLVARLSLDAQFNLACADYTRARDDWDIALRTVDPQRLEWAAANLMTAYGNALGAARDAAEAELRTIAAQNAALVPAQRLELALDVKLAGPLQVAIEPNAGIVLDYGKDGKVIGARPRVKA